MFIFWTLATLMGLAAGLFVLVPVLTARRDDESAIPEQRLDINVALYGERLEDLQSRFESGEIAETEYNELVTEAKRDLLADAAVVDDSMSGESTLVESTSGKLPQSNGKSAATSSVRGRAVSLLIASAVFVPVMAIIGYSDFGLSRGAISDVELARQFRDVDPADVSTYQEMVDALAVTLADQPENIDGLFLLARSYSYLNEANKAVTIYQQLVDRFPGDPSLSVYLAEALFVADDRQMTARVRSAVDRTLKLNPHDITMMEISAVAAIQAGDTRLALSWFDKALKTGVTGERAALIKAAVRRLQGSVPSGEQQAPVTPTGRYIDVHVTAATNIPLPAESTVFIYARAAMGPPAPLAVQRMTLADLPVKVRLDESMAMIEGMGLANFDEIQLIARISTTGSVSVSDGDYEIRSKVINITQPLEPVELLIEQKVGSR